MHPEHPYIDPSAPGGKLTPEDARHHILEHQIITIRSDVKDMKAVMQDIAAAMIKLALVEERQMQVSQALERTNKIQERLETRVEAYQLMNVNAAQAIERRVDTLEAEAPMNKRATEWVFVGVAGFIGLVAPSAIQKFFGG